MAALTRRDVENVMRTVFRRCVECDTSKAPSCLGLNCAKGEICMQTPPTCDACASTQCRPDPSQVEAGPSEKPNVGAIAGGVVGGVVFVAVLVFIVWKFCLKGKRRPYDDTDWQEVDLAQPHEKTDNDFASRRSARASTHTVASMASSVLTRASNIIQIAYIPGVTNRSGPGSPDVLVPPVPPIPAMSPSSAAPSSPYTDSEQHFFVPDFRDSMASGTSDVRSSFARTSIAPSLARGSVASTVYRQNAIVSPLPAQTIVRGKAAVVSVKSSGTNSPLGSPSVETPPVPHIDPKHGGKPMRIQMPRMGSEASVDSQNSIRSTATMGKVRALNITKKKSPEPERPSTTSSLSSSDTVMGQRPLTDISLASTDDGVAHARARRPGADSDWDSDSDADADDHVRSHRSLLRDSTVTEISDSPLVAQSPFSDSSTVDSFPRPAMSQAITSSGSGLRAPMSPIVEEGDRRLSAASSSKRTRSPFADANRSDLR